jgi:hypothetical protein
MILVRYRFVAAAARATPDRAALIFSAYCNGIRADLHPPACVMAAKSMSSSAIILRCADPRRVPTHLRDKPRRDPNPLRPPLKNRRNAHGAQRWVWARASARLCENLAVPATVRKSISGRCRLITRRLNIEFWTTETDTPHSLWRFHSRRRDLWAPAPGGDVFFRLPIRLRARAKPRLRDPARACFDNWNSPPGRRRLHRAAIGSRFR